MEQNSNQHKTTQAEAKTAAREQVGFNLAGYLDDFSKALSVSANDARASHRAEADRRGKSVRCSTK